ncbi:transglycosylase SLT domain-containing protein [Streptomyces xanthophaeus]|uniref:aggregation-promoting factor C-terminal-like domain-containing protein n=1 Tax=Streptomyces xanthophaeus TaxID=67385 RepID=UPI00386B432A|nr:transglycosylase SLT domain-containing protein [Streptomyces xanthophaeus]WST20505.1 transglycosylase SLT domain-containing protein [Streptomyces xanthophaeus]WST22286.1 transglycosylase SLT domain-containing protein [Streptomyces xanthophaeus]WST62739.1 transglycosylase SLT domain-containing protein [Streptomyces xanthophaeus]WST64508.1 transglycosylase SLT domain-containing protein [Streptomyces xanthophaeus]
MPRPSLSPPEGCSVSNAVIRRIAASKKTLVGTVLTLGVAGSMLATVPAQAAPTSAKAIAQQMIKDPAQFAAFNNIVSRESGWNHTAMNSSSGAYGLVQALPASKMASAGSDWKTNPATQIKWGLDYMNSRYGSPVGAWNFWQSHHWY